MRRQQVMDDTTPPHADEHVEHVVMYPRRITQLDCAPHRGRHQCQEARPDAATLRFHRGGSCTSVGPRCSPSRRARSRWFAIHVSGSRSFLRWDPNAPSLNANRKLVSGGRRPTARPPRPSAAGRTWNSARRCRTGVGSARASAVGGSSGGYTMPSPVAVRPAGASDPDHPGSFGSAGSTLGSTSAAPGASGSTDGAFRSLGAGRSTSASSRSSSGVGSSDAGIVRCLRHASDFPDRA